MAKISSKNVKKAKMSAVKGKGEKQRTKETKDTPIEKLTLASQAERTAQFDPAVDKRILNRFLDGGIMESDAIKKKLMSLPDCAKEAKVVRIEQD